MHQGVTSNSVNYMTGLVQNHRHKTRQERTVEINQEVLFCLCGSQSNAKWSELFTLQPENKTTAGRTQRTIRHLAHEDTQVIIQESVLFSYITPFTIPFFIYSRSNMKMRENVSLKHIKEASISVAKI